MRKITISVFLLALISNVYGQEISIKEEFITLPTYPFSDPDPVVRPGKIYPYFRFEGYSSSAISQKHKMVVMENKWIKLWITPDIGGKIWGALDKKTGKYFIYYNNVVKFRDIAMRGPWTSGGIEFNFGSIGHAPTTVSPVDYHIQNNPDGSVSCFVGAIELTSRTEWRVEIRLPADKAWFETRSSWNNPTNLKTSLYHWQTAAADVGDDLKYYFPGNANIGHAGEAAGWPVLKNGTDISLYRNNNYGSSHSYHVLGEYSDWFAGYFQNNDYGFGHWSRYPNKPGKKIWIWALSRSGAIWENLLTDPDKGNKQYTEIQTGLLFNQEADESTMSPFKHLYFEPGAVETFSEKWFPISGTKGITSISQEGILNIIKNEKGFNLLFQSLTNVKDKLQIIDPSGKILYEYPLDLIPEQLFEKSVDLNPENLTIRLKDGELYHELSGTKNTTLDRPLEMPANFDWESVYGLYTRGVEKSRQRLYEAAKDFFNKCLSKDPNYIPAFTGLAEIDFKQMRFDDAEKKLLHVISFDTYDPDANFLYGSLLLLKKEYNKARDAFGVTLRSSGYKSASLNQLALIALKEKRLEEAWEYVINAKLYNGLDANIYKTATVIARLRGDDVNYKMMLQSLLSIDPLCHFASFEKYFMAKDPVSLKAFTSGINAELKYETYIELALWYFNSGLEAEAFEVMQLSPEHPMADYLTGYLASRKKDELKTSFYFDRAIRADDKLVFPYRQEYIDILKWADQRQFNWKTKYYSAMLYWSTGQTDIAAKYFKECEDLPDSYSFYLSRGSFVSQNGGNGEEDFLKALKYGSKDWRPYHLLHNYYLSVLNFEKALSVSQNAMKIFTGSYIIKFDHAQSLLNTGKYEDCIKLLKNTEILPHEGAGYGRTIWQQANLLEALRLINDGKINPALGKVASSRLWPENLGVGRPYNVNESLEDLIEAACMIKNGQKEKADKLLTGVPLLNNRNRSSGTESLAGVIALKAMKKYKEADELLSSWSEKENDKIMKAWALNLLSSQNSVKQEGLTVENKELNTAITELPKNNLGISILEKISKLLVGKEE